MSEYERLTERAVKNLKGNNYPQNYYDMYNRLAELEDKIESGDLVFDGFMGSFTTAVACHKLNRNFIGAELDKEYFELGLKRLNQETNQISLFD